jgi:GntR family transcriptional regulator
LQGENGVTAPRLRPVSRESQIPLYHQVANDLRERIVSGAWPVGRRIPTEQELTRLFGASRITIRQALRNLEQEGLVSREPGRGSFVRDATITAGPRRLTSFTQEMRARGQAPSSRVLSLAEVPADELVAAQLGLEAGDPVVRLDRLRFGAGEAVGIQTAHLPSARFPGLTEVDFSQASLYEQLQQRYGTTIDEAEETYIVARIEGEAAERLEVPSGTPGLVVERVSWSGRHAIEFTRSVMRGDRYRVVVRLRREPIGGGRNPNPRPPS